MEELKEFAKRLTNGNNGRDIDNELVQEAKEKGIVIVYGYSDDLMEFEGAMYDEFDCFDGGTCYITPNGDLLDGEYTISDNKSIEAIWCAKDSEWTWSYKTDIPHETFEMIDDDEKYCLGLVFYKKDLKGE